MDHHGRKPIGIALWETTQLVMRTFDEVLAEHGGNRSIWFVFLGLADTEHPTQRELAQAVGISEATLTHHLDTLERRGLVARERDEHDRRVQRIRFTPEGLAAFAAMRDAAVGLDDRIREIVGAERIGSLLEGLAAVSDAVAPGGGRVPPPVP